MARGNHNLSYLLEEFESALRNAQPLRFELSGGSASLEYTQCDFIVSGIDVAAQYALYQMLKGNSASRKASLGMLAAIRVGLVGGIYQQDQLVPARRAKSLGRGWWQLIPKGEVAVCVREPASDPPIIVFKKSIASDRFRLGQALQDAWSKCGLRELPAPPPSGKPCARRPPPPPPPPAEKTNGQRPPDSKPKARECDWETTIDWNEKFERYFQSCCTGLSAARSFCEFLPTWAPLLPQFEICRLSSKEFDESVDRCIFQNVHAEIVQETGIVASTGNCSPAAVTGRRLAEWKRRTGRKCS